MKDLTKALIAAAIIGTGVATGGFGLMAGGAAAGTAGAAGGAAAGGAAAGAGTAAATGAGTAAATGAGTAAATGAGTAAATGAGTAAATGASGGGLASLMATPGFGASLTAGSAVFSTLFAPDPNEASVYNTQISQKTANDQMASNAYQQANVGVQNAFESNKRNEIQSQQMLGDSLKRFFI